MLRNMALNDKEKHAIKVLNFIAEHDGIIHDEDDRRAILEHGIRKFVAKSRQHLCSITVTAYPIKIKY